jgi:hypothetical protein
VIRFLENERKTALSNALGFISRERRLPSDVFTARWDGYLFFYPHLMFTREFVSVASHLLRFEGAGTIVLVNLGSMISVDDAPPGGEIFLESSTSGSEYISMLRGDGTAPDWLVLVDRYICCSDIGNWAIYCEKQNDVAVFAWRAAVRGVVEKIKSELKASTIDAVHIRQEDRYDFTGLVPEWRTSLRNNYS